eukprot:scaffold1638_cov325-Chaetoceros_neogracile.AAC.4
MKRLALVFARRAKQVRLASFAIVPPRVTILEYDDGQASVAYQSVVSYTSSVARYEENILLGRTSSFQSNLTTIF